MTRGTRGLALVALVAVAGGVVPATEAPRAAPAARAAAPAVGASLSRRLVRIGEPTIYRGWISGAGRARVRFLPADGGGALSWGPMSTRASAPRGPSSRPASPGGPVLSDRETLYVECPLQAFALGEISIPGLRVAVDDGRGERVSRLPTLRLVVTPVLTAADSNADLRSLRGPIAAPWWERVPWRWVILGALGLMILVAIAIAWRRRPRPAAVVAPAPARDPAAVALAELAALKRLALPAHGRFAEHAFQLGRIVRRFMEATVGTPLPGDTTPEFVRHLEPAALAPEDLRRLADLMRSWDRVKFARAPATVDESTLAEQAVESLVRRLASRAAGRAA